jgi:hypothetical protein
MERERADLERHGSRGWHPEDDGSDREPAEDAAREPA